MRTRRLFLVGDDPKARRLLPSSERFGPWEIYSFREPAAAVEALARERPDLILVRLPSADGQAAARARDLELAAGSTPLLCIGPAPPPPLPEAARWLPESATRADVEAILAELLAAEPASFSGIVGRSRPMAEVYRLIERLAPTTATVLIAGESGTGKELVARALHSHSQRKERPFVAVSCAALPQELLESELFGHEKGAFTGANWQKPGRFELADGGTLFLDEVGEINAATQLKLLRVLQEKEFERVGGIQPLKVDVRLIAASNRNLERSVREERFRLDLYYRLRVVQVDLPPLRERREDIPLLVEHLVRKFAAANARPVRGVTDEALELLLRYDWPGNVRELENALEHAVVLCDPDVEYLPPALLPGNIRRGESGLLAIAPALAREERCS